MCLQRVSKCFEHRLLPRLQARGFSEDKFELSLEGLRIAKPPQIVRLGFLGAHHLTRIRRKFVIKGEHFFV